VIVVELFPMKGQVPRNLVEAENRVIQLIFSSKMQLDQKFFGKIDAYSRLMKIIDAYLTPEGRDQIKKKDLNKAYEELKGHKVIKPIIITSHMPEPLSAATDFSRTAIEDRIECGYQDACDTLREHHLI
jgi:NTE family protein